MSQNKTTGVFVGKTYSLLGDESTSDRYYKNIREITNAFLKRYPDEKKLLSLIRSAGNKSSLFKRPSLSGADRSFVSFMKKTLSEFLSIYTKGVKYHLKTLPLSKRFDPILKTTEEGLNAALPPGTLKRYAGDALKTVLSTSGAC
jgi:hypothetical protein